MIIYLLIFRNFHNEKRYIMDTLWTKNKYIGSQQLNPLRAHLFLNEF